MKNIIVLLFVVFGLISSCKPSDPCPLEKAEQEECVKERWMTLYKNNNKSLFELEEGKMDPYEEIKKLLLDGEIRLWTERKNNPEWLTSPLPSMIHDSIAYRGDSLYYNIYFDYESEGFAPLKTVNGGDSMYTYPDGSQAFLYPLPKYEPLTFEEISEIRIKEILVYDSITNKNMMKSSLIGFDVYAGHHNTLFWVKVDDLKEHIKINKSWVDKVINRKYDGFIYKQYSCKDPVYEWKKVYH